VVGAVVVQMDVVLVAASTKLAGALVVGGETAVFPLLSAEVALKKYVEPLVRPDRVIECDVTGVALLALRFNEPADVP
jgi:hypothetical protein